MLTAHDGTNRLRARTSASALCLAIAAFATCAGVRAQSFEAASIRPSTPIVDGSFIGPKGGPGTADPGLYVCQKCNLTSLVEDAYDLPYYRVVAPDWMKNTRFDVQARIPEGISKDQFHRMLQDLLITRFKLAVHRDQREMTTYRMVIAKGGIKMVPSIEVQPSASIGIPNVEITPATKPVLPKPGWGRWAVQKKTSAEIAEFLSFYVKGAVEDATGLTGVYDPVLTWDFNAGRATVNPDPDAGPDIFRAAQEQLGLKLEPRKGPVEIVIVDRCERTPTEN